MKRYTYLGSYHKAVCNWINKIVTMYEPATVKTLKITQTIADGFGFIAPFVFQDEDARHFNHDVKLECQRRLQAIT